MLDAIDGYREDAWRPPPIETNITAAIKYVAETRARTQAENYDEEMRAHFDTLLGALEAHLTARLKEGNESDLGMPLSGSPGFVCSVASMNWEGPGLYRAVARSVKEWFALRDNLLFRIVPSVADRRRFLGQRFALL
jgi:hypothetical protein